MRIDIDKDGKEQVTLTKAEQVSLAKARIICESLDRHSSEDGDVDASKAATALEAIIGRYCTATEAVGSLK